MSTAPLDVPPVTLLGPQRRPGLASIVESLGLTGPFAVVNAGWQDREAEDQEIASHLPGEMRNLMLWQRRQEVLEQDPEWAEADQRRQAVLEEMQDLYLIGVGHAMNALLEILATPERQPSLVERAVTDAEEVLHALDRRHLQRVAAVDERFYERMRPHDRPIIARHREEVAEILATSASVVIPGGHIGVLLHTLHLFHVAPVLATRPVVAWSAGAMALTERVVLFNDRASHGDTSPEMYAAGIGLVPGVVALPAPHQRLQMDDQARMASLAKRFAPSRCLLLDPGVRVELTRDRQLPPDAPVVGSDGAASTMGATAAIPEAGDV